MEGFIDAQSGSRLAVHRTLVFEDYDSEELVRIVESNARSTSTS